MIAGLFNQRESQARHRMIDVSSLDLYLAILVQHRRPPSGFVYLRLRKTMRTLKQPATQSVADDLMYLDANLHEREELILVALDSVVDLGDRADWPIDRERLVAV
jgi:hypothetical protein